MGPDFGVSGSFWTVLQEQTEVSSAVNVAIYFY